MQSNQGDVQNWQPDSTKVTEIKKIIEKLFDHGSKSSLEDATQQIPTPRPPDNFIEQCAKIAVFLMDENAVVRQLEKLNAILLAKIQAGADPNDPYLLRKTIEEEITRLGFQPKLGKAVALVDPDQFRSAVAKGWLLKDAALGYQRHGEITHSLQWLAIAWQQEQTNFLGESAIHVFKKLGSDNSVYHRESPKPSAKTLPQEKSLWDFVVDSFQTTVGFRTPEKLHLFLLNTKQNSLSTLSSFLNKRFAKRKKMGPYKKYSETDLVNSSIFPRKKDREVYEHKEFKNILTPKVIK